MKHPGRSLMLRFAIVLLVLILPFNILGLVTAVNAYHHQRENMELMVSAMMDTTVTRLQSRIQNTNFELYELMSNNLYLNQMKTSSNDSAYQIARYQLFQNLTERIRISDMADAIFLYLPEYDDYIHVPGFDHVAVDTIPHRHFISADVPIRSSWALSEDGSELYRVMYDRGVPMVFGAAINTAGVLAEMQGTSIYQTLQVSLASAPPEQADGRIVFQREVVSEVYLIATLSTRELDTIIGSLPWMLIIFFLLYFALIPVLLIFVRKSVALPLETLNKAHQRLEQGEQDFRIQEPAATTEFAQAYESFNHMSDTLQTLQQEILTKELENKQLQIDYLQLQIRPHFLLNSFNVLYTLIQRGEKASAQEMVLFLSDYFRYLFRSGSELQPFSQERGLMEDYLRMTKIYYPDAFQVTWMLDPLLDLLPVPPLLLHSFVENIIAHALLPDRTIHIYITGEYEAGIAIFQISDDGAGIRPDAVEAINHAGDGPAVQGENVGIRNSALRLKHYYGPSASVVCESEENVGTTFTIRIPCLLEEDASEDQG